MVMEFTSDPGELPFSTVRDAKWANRLEGHDWVEIRGVHGCRLRPQICLVKAITPITRERALSGPWPTPWIYGRGRIFVLIDLELMPEDERVRRGIPPAGSH